MANKKYTIDIDVNGQQGLDELQKDIKLIENTISNIEKKKAAFEVLAKGAAVGSEAFKKYTAELDRLNGKMKNFQDASMGQSLNEQVKSLVVFGSAILNVSAGVSALANSFEEVDKDTQKYMLRLQAFVTITQGLMELFEENTILQRFFGRMGVAMDAAADSSSALADITKATTGTLAASTVVQGANTAALTANSAAQVAETAASTASTSSEIAQAKAIKETTAALNEQSAALDNNADKLRFGEIKGSQKVFDEKIKADELEIERRSKGKNNTKLSRFGDKLEDTKILLKNTKLGQQLIGISSELQRSKLGQTLSSVSSGFSELAGSAGLALRSLGGFWGMLAVGALVVASIALVVTKVDFLKVAFTGLSASVRVGVNAFTDFIGITTKEKRLAEERLALQLLINEATQAGIDLATSDTQRRKVSGVIGDIEAAKELVKVNERRLKLSQDTYTAVVAEANAIIASKNKESKIVNAALSRQLKGTETYNKLLGDSKLLEAEINKEFAKKTKALEDQRKIQTDLVLSIEDVRARELDLRDALKERISENLQDELDKVEMLNIAYSGNLEKRIAYVNRLANIEKAATLDRLKSITLEDAERVRLNSKLLDLERERIKAVKALQREAFVSQLDEVDRISAKVATRVGNTRQTTISGQKLVADTLVKLEADRDRRAAIKEATVGVTVTAELLDLIEKQKANVEKMSKAFQGVREATSTIASNTTDLNALFKKVSEASKSTIETITEEITPEGLESTKGRLDAGLTARLTLNQRLLKAYDREVEVQKELSKVADRYAALAGVPRDDLFKDFDANNIIAAQVDPRLAAQVKIFKNSIETEQKTLRQLQVQLNFPFLNPKGEPNLATSSRNVGADNVARLKGTIAEQDKLRDELLKAKLEFSDKGIEAPVLGAERDELIKETQREAEQINKDIADAFLKQGIKKDVVDKLVTDINDVFDTEIVKIGENSRIAVNDLVTSFEELIQNAINLRQMRFQVSLDLTLTRTGNDFFKDLEGRVFRDFQDSGISQNIIDMILGGEKGPEALGFAARKVDVLDKQLKDLTVTMETLTLTRDLMNDTLLDMSSEVISGDIVSEEAQAKAIEKLKGEIEATSKEIDGLNSDISGLTKEVNRLKNQPFFLSKRGKEYRTFIQDAIEATKKWRKAEIDRINAVNVLEEQSLAFRVEQTEKAIREQQNVEAGFADKFIELAAKKNRTIAEEKELQDLLNKGSGDTLALLKKRIDLEIQLSNLDAKKEEAISDIDRQANASTNNLNELLNTQIANIGVFISNLAPIADNLIGLFGTFSDAMVEKLESDVDKIKGILEVINGEIDKANSRIAETSEELKDAQGSRRKQLLDNLDAERARLVLLQAQKDKNADKEEDLAKRRARIEKQQQAISQVTNTINQVGLAISAVAAVFKDPTPSIFVKLAAVAATVAAVTAGVGAIKSFEDGGMLDGPSHAQGGIRGRGSFANVEVEGGEFIVNKRSAAKHQGLLEAINKDKFAQGGTLPTLSNDPLAGRIDSLERSMVALSERPIYVAVTDINKESDRLANVVDLARF